MNRRNQDAIHGPVVWAPSGVPRPLSTGDQRLQVYVIFTTFKETTAALKTALHLARDLNALTVLLVTQVVPAQFSYSSPPVPLSFNERRAHAVVMNCSMGEEVAIRLYLCGDKHECLCSILKPHSLLVMGGKKHWWGGREQNLGKALRAAGHEVIFIEGGRAIQTWRKF